MKVTHDGRRLKVDVRADGQGLVSHAGSALLAQVADKTGLTRALSAAVGEPGLRAGSHDRGHVIRDLAVMLADGGDCLADLRAVGDQEVLFGPVASTSTAFRLIDRIASTPGLIDALRGAHATARERVWKLAGAPSRVTIDLDATLLTAHSDKEGAAPTFKRGYGFHPLLAYCDQTGEALAGELRPGNAGANTVADQIAVVDQALEQIPEAHIETIEILLRVDSAGACHRLLDWCREARIGFSVGYDLTEPVRDAIAELERGHRARARVEDHIRNDKDTGLRNPPFRDFEHNRVWLELVRLAHDLIAWTQRLLLSDELAKAEPKRLRYRLLHVAGRLAVHARTATLRLPVNWPWANDLAAAFQRLRKLTPLPA